MNTNLKIVNEVVMQPVLPSPDEVSVVCDAAVRGPCRIILASRNNNYFDRRLLTIIKNKKGTVTAQQNTGT